MTLRRAIRLTLFVTGRVCLPCQAIREQPRQPLFLTAESAPTPAFAGRRAHAGSVFGPNRVGLAGKMLRS